MVYVSVSPTGRDGLVDRLGGPDLGEDRRGRDVGSVRGRGRSGSAVSVGGGVGVTTWVGQPIASWAIVPRDAVGATVRSSPVEWSAGVSRAGSGCGSWQRRGFRHVRRRRVQSWAQAGPACPLVVACQWVGGGRRSWGRRCCGVFVGRGVAVGGTGVFVAWMEGVATRVEVSDAAAVPVLVAVAVVVPPGVRVTLGDAVTVTLGEAVTVAARD